VKGRDYYVSTATCFINSKRVARSTLSPDGCDWVATASGSGVGVVGVGVGAIVGEGFGVVESAVADQDITARSHRSKTSPILKHQVR